MQPLFKISLLVFLLLQNLYAQDSLALRNRIDSFFSGKDFLSKTTIALEVYDLTSLKNLYSLNSTLLLHPASNMKLLTSAAGLLFLKDFSFKTSLYYSGEIVNGVLLGDIYVKGECDPEFSLNDLDSLVHSINALGINEISGNIYADLSYKDDLFWGNGWMWDDDPSGDAPYLSALNINYNIVRVFVAPAADSIIGVRTEPASAYFAVDNKLVISTAPEKETLFITRDWQNRSNQIKLTGTINYFDQTERVKILNVYEPAIYFLTLFTEALIKSRIDFKKEVGFKVTPSFAQELFTVYRPVDSIMNSINKVSNNLSAEMLLYALGEKLKGKPASAKNGLMLIDSLIRLSGLNPADYRLVDGSGVSHYNLLSSELLISVLKYLYFQQPETYGKLYLSLAVAGKDGTLRNRMIGTSAEGKVFGKTGTLSGVSSLSGYVQSASGNQLALSIMIQNFTGDAAYARYLQDELCKIIAEY